VNQVWIICEKETEMSAICNPKCGYATQSVDMQPKVWICNPKWMRTGTFSFPWLEALGLSPLAGGSSTVPLAGGSRTFPLSEGGP
jgi:hypothetical protein